MRKRVLKKSQNKKPKIRKVEEKKNRLNIKELDSNDEKTLEDEIENSETEEIVEDVRKTLQQISTSPVLEKIAEAGGTPVGRIISEDDEPEEEVKYADSNSNYENLRQEEEAEYPRYIEMSEQNNIVGASNNSNNLQRERKIAKRFMLDPMTHKPLETERHEIDELISIGKDKDYFLEKEYE